MQQVHRSSSSHCTELSRSEPRQVVPRVTATELQKPGYQMRNLMHLHLDAEKVLQVVEKLWSVDENLPTPTCRKQRGDAAVTECQDNGEEGPDAT